MQLFYCLVMYSSVYSLCILSGCSCWTNTKVGEIPKYKQIQRWAFLDWQESVQSVCPNTEQRSDGDGAPNSLPPISELFFVPLQIKGLCDYQKNHVTLKMMHNVQKLRMHTLTVLYLTEKVIYGCFSQSVYFGNFYENCPDCLSLLHFQLIALPQSLTHLM